jgi:hypothetical protein
MDFPTDLLEAFNPTAGGGVIAFIGSGPSCHAGVPSWADLLRRIAAEVNAHEEVEHYIQKGKFLEVAQFLAELRSETDIKERVAKQIKRATRAPSPIHELIVRLPFAGIITTNYDLLLTAADKSRRFNLPITHKSTGLREQLHQHFILHLHGHVNEPETIVLTRQGYDEIKLENARVRRFLSTIFQSFVVLFIGFGFADDHVDDLLREFKETEAMGESSVFGLVPSPPVRDRVRESNLRFRLINPIFLLDNADYAVQSLRDWLEELHDALTVILESHRYSIESVCPVNVLERLRNLLASNEWRAEFLEFIGNLPYRPDLKNLARNSLGAEETKDLFTKLRTSEMREVLMSLNKIRRNETLEDALSCFPPPDDSK